MAMASIAFCMFTRGYISKYMWLIMDWSPICAIQVLTHGPMAHMVVIFRRTKNDNIMVKKNIGTKHNGAYIYIFIHTTLVYNVIQYDYSIYGLTRYTGWSVELDSWISLKVQLACLWSTSCRCNVFRCNVRLCFFVAKGFMEGEPWKMLGYNIA